jgi:hypothetical protein
MCNQTIGENKMSGLTYRYILTHDNKKPSCADNATAQARLNQIENITYSRDYAEKGYTIKTEKGILFGNWNYFSRKACDLLEQAGYELEWEDEWDTCADCGRAIRTSADSYGWTASYVILNDCELVCLDCLDFGDYLESIEDNPDKACTPDINPNQYGYTLIDNSFESGLHPGQNDNPKSILENMQSKGYKHLVFRVSRVGQFDVNFEIYQKIDNSNDN